MSAGEASMFPPIPPEHPLAEAARIVNAYSEERGLEATLEWLGMATGAGELAYLGEQRALRAVAGAALDLNLGAGLHGARDAEAISRAIVETPLWRDMRMLLVACYLDGFAIGWKGHELSGRQGEGEGEGEDERHAELFDVAMGHALELAEAAGGDTSVWSVSSQDDSRGVYEIKFEIGYVRATQDGAEWLERFEE